MNLNLTPTYFYDSIWQYPEYFNKENFILSLKLIANKNEVLVTSNDDTIRLFKLSISNTDDKLMKNEIQEIFSFKESHHIYDLDM